MEIQKSTQTWGGGGDWNNCIWSAIQYYTVHPCQTPVANVHPIKRCGIATSLMICTLATGVRQGRITQNNQTGCY